MPATFIESDAIDMSKEKDWAYQIGLLDWDKTQIVFTKRELLDFLTSVGVTVDTSLLKIQKLPRYAKFGKFSGETAPATSASRNEAAAEESGPLASSGSSNPPAGFKPTRRVRDAPGGKTSALFGDDEEEDPAPPARKPAAPEPEEPEISSPRRSGPRGGGGPTLGGLGMAEEDNPPKKTDGFKPTRRVRDNPGGEDHLHDLFS
ncbi:hypothetical protein FRB90_002683 [Tulasnella sp. 427]|nr:hypothetical protein FRB90_002683 [Tulasnella sp. 427]